MKKTMIVIGLLVVSGAVDARASTYAIDSDHAFAVFRAEHLGIGVTYGRFDKVSGSFELNEKQPSASSVQIMIDPASVNSGVKKRDGHLRGPDFLNAKQFREFSFESSVVKRVGDGRYEVKGTLKLRGVSKPLTVTVVSTGEGRDPWGGYRAGFKTSFELRRSEFGMTYGLSNGLVGDTITVEFAVEGLRK
ncbi:MAG: YceI family protein [Myxococcota bacterium]